MLHAVQTIFSEPLSGAMLAIEQIKIDGFKKPFYCIFAEIENKFS
jgi:hypothetical protein